MLNVFMLTVTNKTIMLSAFMLNVVMLIAIAPIESDYEIFIMLDKSLKARVPGLGLSRRMECSKPVFRL
jgi:hypothetical protein